jgi:hypothetical protein
MVLTCYRLLAAVAEPLVQVRGEKLAAGVDGAVLLQTLKRVGIKAKGV